jgi:hypothetical protein
MLEKWKSDMPPITPHEPDAELITPEDVEKDFASLNDALFEKRVQRLARELMRQPDIYATLQKLVASGRFANEVAALAHAVRTLQFAIETKQEA